MRTIHCAPLARDVSALGFGCASMGSRVSERDARRALDLAYGQGVTWFDVAPPYGDGEAERILGTFIKGKRDRVAICTKAGIARPRAATGARRLARTAARALVGLHPGLRARVAKARPAARHERLDAAMIEASVVASLRHLAIDCVDVLALHDPSVDEVGDDEVLAALDRIRRKGYARCVGIAGPETSVAAGLASPCFAMGQCPDDPLTLDIDALVRGAGGDAFIVTHSIFQEKLLARLRRVPALQDHLPDALLHYALSRNREGVVLTSMFNPEHTRKNCAIANVPPSRDLVASVERSLRAAASGHADG